MVIMTTGKIDGVKKKSKKEKKLIIKRKEKKKLGSIQSLSPVLKITRATLKIACVCVLFVSRGYCLVSGSGFEIQTGK